MRRRTLKIGVKIGSFQMPLGEVLVQKFAKIRTPQTELVCPACGKIPAWQGGYKCECGKTYNHWSRLKRIVKATRQVIEKAKLTVKGEVVTAMAYVMDSKIFAEKYADATVDETMF